MTERQFRVGDRVRLKADQDAYLSESAMRGKKSDFVAYVDSDPEFIGFALDGEVSWLSSRFELVEAANVADGVTKVVPFPPDSWDDNGKLLTRAIGER